MELSAFYIHGVYNFYISSECIKLHDINTIRRCQKSNSQVRLESFPIAGLDWLIIINLEHALIDFDNLTIHIVKLT